jgi:MFS transporter, putative metabolite:H+ symporter
LTITADNASLRASGICNTLGRGAMNYGLPGVVWLMIGLLLVQILAVYYWGVEPGRRPLEGLDPKTG